MSPVPSDSPHRRHDFIGLVGSSIVFLAVAVLFELALVIVGASSRFAGLFEIQSGLLANLPAFIAVVLPVALLCGGLEWAFRWDGPAVRASGRRMVVSGGAFVFAAATAFGVGGGRHLAKAGIRLGFAGVVGLVGAAAAFFAWETLARWRWHELKLYRVLLSLGLVLTCFVNRAVLVHLYPAFHIALGVFEVLFFSLLLHSWISPGRGLALAGAAIAFVAGVATVPAASLGARLDNFRFIVAERSELLGLGIELGVKIAPSPPVDRSVLARGLGSRRQKSGMLDLRGRSILLVTVDALRADHLGVYGYDRPTTPVLDALSKRGTRFEAAYAATPHTSYSLTSLMTGKYMRPLLLQGAGADSETWPKLLQTYGYRTAGFYPPAVFFIDGDLFARFRDSRFDFEYAKVEFAEGKVRTDQVDAYLREQPQGKPIFAWVHLFGPHEPYVEGTTSFGPRDVDRYDSEIADTDRSIGELVRMMRERDPDSLVIVSADHGEEFGEHGGRYHGTTVYEEQVRVPLLFQGTGIEAGRVVQEPVQTIDLLPTILGALEVPVPPRVRGRDLRPLLHPGSEKSEGLALAETEEYSLLAEGRWRLICARRSASCQLFDRQEDPFEKRDVSSKNPTEFSSMREKTRALAASHGEYEAEGLRAEGKNLPAAILRGLAGDVDAAPELSRLLDDVEPTLRRKSAQLLFLLGAKDFASAMRLALSREEDEETRAWLALGLTRSGSLAPLTLDLLTSDREELRRFSALVLAEQGDFRGTSELLEWLRDRKDLRFEDAKLIVQVLGRSHQSEALPVLVSALSDVRLRPFVARALGELGDKDATPRLLSAFSGERYATARRPLAESLYKLGATSELAPSLVRFLGVPDPMDGGLELALNAKLNEKLGGLEERELAKVRNLVGSGVTLDVVVPPAPKGHTDTSVRFVALVRATEKAELRLARGVRKYVKSNDVRYRNQPEVSANGALVLAIPADGEWRQISAVLPPDFGARPGQAFTGDLLLTGNAELKNLLFVPVREEIPPPEPKPWKPGAIQDDE